MRTHPIDLFRPVCAFRRKGHAAPARRAKFSSMRKFLSLISALTAFISFAVAQSADDGVDLRAAREALEAGSGAIAEADAALAVEADDSAEAGIAAARALLAERRETLGSLIEDLRAAQARAQSLLAPAADAAQADSETADDRSTDDAPDEPDERDAAATGADKALTEEEAADLRERLAELDALLSQAVALEADTLQRLSVFAYRERLASLQKGVDARRAEIGDVQRALETTDPLPDYLALRERLRNLRAAGTETIAPLTETRDDLQADLDRLGPAPSVDDEPEAAEISAEREALSVALLKEDAIIRQSDLNQAEIDRLIDDIARLRRDVFYAQILARGPPPFDLDVLRVAADSFIDGVRAAEAQLSYWRDARATSGTLTRSYAAIAISVVVGLFLFGPAQSWTNARILGRLEALDPTPGRRAGAAFIRVLARAVPGIVAGAIVFETLKALGVVDQTTVAVARLLWLGFVALLVADAGATAALAPLTKGWRLVPLESACGQIVRGLVLLLVALFFIDKAMTAGAAIYGGGQELARVQSAVVAILMAMVYLALSRRKLWRLAPHREDAFDEDAKSLWRNVRRLLLIIAVVIIVAALIGYVALAHYVATRVFILFGLAALGLFIRLLAHEAPSLVRSENG